MFVLKLRRQIILLMALFILGQPAAANPLALFVIAEMTGGGKFYMDGEWYSAVEDLPSNRRADHLVLYINGIATTPTGFVAGYEATRKLVARKLPAGTKVIGLYNQSVAEDVENILPMVCSMEHTLQLDLRKYCPATVFGVVGDILFEALLEYIGVPANIHVVAKLQNLLLDVRQAGSTLTIIAHSQGNLVTRTALKDLLNNQPGGVQLLKGVGLVMVGSPASPSSMPGTLINLPAGASQLISAFGTVRGGGPVALYSVSHRSDAVSYLGQDRVWDTAITDLASLDVSGPILVSQPGYYLSEQREFIPLDIPGGTQVLLSDQSGREVEVTGTRSLPSLEPPPDARGSFASHDYLSYLRGNGLSEMERALVALLPAGIDKPVLSHPLTFANGDAVLTKDWVNIRAFPRVIAESFLYTLPPESQGLVTGDPIHANGNIFVPFCVTSNVETTPPNMPGGSCGYIASAFLKIDVSDRATPSPKLIEIISATEPVAITSAQLDTDFDVTPEQALARACESCIPYAGHEIEAPTTLRPIQIDSREIRLRAELPENSFDAAFEVCIDLQPCVIASYWGNPGSNSRSFGIDCETSYQVTALARSGSSQSTAWSRGNVINATTASCFSPKPVNIQVTQSPVTGVISVSFDPFESTTSTVVQFRGRLRDPRAVASDIYKGGDHDLGSADTELGVHRLIRLDDVVAGSELCVEARTTDFAHGDGAASEWTDEVCIVIEGHYEITVDDIAWVNLDVDVEVGVGHKIAWSGRVRTDLELLKSTNGAEFLAAIELPRAGDRFHFDRQVSEGDEVCYKLKHIPTGFESVSSCVTFRAQWPNVQLASIDRIDDRNALILVTTDYWVDGSYIRCEYSIDGGIDWDNRCGSIHAQNEREDGRYELIVTYPIDYSDALYRVRTRSAGSSGPVGSPVVFSRNQEAWSSTEIGIDVLEDSGPLSTDAPSSASGPAENVLFNRSLSVGVRATPTDGADLSVGEIDHQGNSVLEATVNTGWKGLVIGFADQTILQDTMINFTLNCDDPSSTVGFTVQDGGVEIGYKIFSCEAQLYSFAIADLDGLDTTPSTFDEIRWFSSTPQTFRLHDVSIEQGEQNEVLHKNVIVLFDGLLMGGVGAVATDGADLSVGEIDHQGNSVLEATVNTGWKGLVIGFADQTILQDTMINFTLNCDDPSSTVGFTVQDGGVEIGYKIFSCEAQLYSFAIADLDGLDTTPSTFDEIRWFSSTPQKMALRDVFMEETAR